MGRLAIQRILEGYGYELTGIDVIDAYNHFMAAAQILGMAQPGPRRRARHGDETTRSGFSASSYTPVLALATGYLKPRKRHQQGATDMDKTKLDEALSRRPIAKRIVAKMKLHWQRKVANIKNVIAGHAMAEESTADGREPERACEPRSGSRRLRLRRRTRCRSCRSNSRP